MEESLLKTVSTDFAVEILRLAKRLQKNNDYVIANQISRSGTSIGANIREAQYAQSRADFITKLQIALKEANETGYWLELIFKGKFCPEDDSTKELYNTCTKLKMLLIRSLNTAKQQVVKK